MVTRTPSGTIPTESDTVSVSVGYHENISETDLAELADSLGDAAEHLESLYTYAVDEDSQIHNCTVAELSQKD